jgi:hypothetical protein
MCSRTLINVLAARAVTIFRKKGKYKQANNQQPSAQQRQAKTHQTNTHQQLLQLFLNNIRILTGIMHH